MMWINIETENLLKYVRRLEEMPVRNKASIARSLNEVGDGVVREMSQLIAKETGIGYERVRSMIESQRATPNNHTYNIKVSSSLAGEPADDIPRRREEFMPGSLVNVVTAGDDKVCQVCEDIAAGSPYTIEDARTRIPAHGGPIGTHNCRCTLMPYRSLRKMSVSEGSAAEKVDLRYTMKQLAERVKEDMILNMRAV